MEDTLGGEGMGVVGPGTGSIIDCRRVTLRTLLSTC
jgi:hypothetical protein